MKCGVELGQAEQKCPLCGLPAYHPDLPAQSAIPSYPKQWNGHNTEATGWRNLLSVSFLLAFLSCLIIDFVNNAGVSWSGFVMAGLATAYILFILPMWMRRPVLPALLPIDFTVIGLMLLYIDLATHGKWFLSFAFPVTAMYGLFATVIAILLTCTRKGRFFIIGGGTILLGCSAMLLEFFLHLTFGTKMFVWSLYVVGVLGVPGLFWILAGIIPPLGNALRKRTFV